MSAVPAAKAAAKTSEEKARKIGTGKTAEGSFSMAAPASVSKGRSIKEKTGRTRISLDRNADKEFPGVDPQTTSSVSSGGKGGGYGDIIARYAAANGVPVSLAHAVVRIESNYRANARGSAGEVGLMQIKPATARGLGYSGSTKALYDPETNIKWGMKYLGMAHKLGGGSTCSTILKYNAGHAAKRMNPTSAAYCSKVKRHLAS